MTNKQRKYNRLKQARWRKKNRVKARKTARDWARQQKAILVALLGGVCQDCGRVFPNCCFHFDHRNPFEKSFEIGKKNSATNKKTLKEIKKCDLVCSNCHAIRTSQSEAFRNKLVAVWATKKKDKKTWAQLCESRSISHWTNKHE